MIAITEEIKEEWEDKIAELDIDAKNGNLTSATKLLWYKELLSKAIILPIEESWEVALGKIDENECENLTDCIKKQFPNGAIIKPK